MFHTNIDFLKSNQELMKFCMIAKFHLINNNLEQYAQAKNIVVTLIIKEFGQMPVLWPNIIADKLINDVELPKPEKKEVTLDTTPSANDDSYNKEKDVITMNDLDWW